jgi:hypothetical protein
MQRQGRLSDSLARQLPLDEATQPGRIDRKSATEECLRSLSAPRQPMGMTSLRRKSRQIASSCATPLAFGAPAK